MNKANKMFLMLILVVVFYQICYIFNTSFIANNIRYFVLFDDAMISMRFAENLANGNGLVWNKGELVEGFTNPLWVVLMSIFHIFHVTKEKISLFVQLSGAIFTVLNILIIKKISDKIFKNTYISFGACVLFSFYLPSIMWSLSGMEVSLLTLTLCCSVYLLLVSIEKDKQDYKYLLLLGIGTFIRIDFIVPAFALILTGCLILKEKRISSLLRASLIIVTFAAVQTSLRYLYYGEIFPNTYYLKMTGFPVDLRLLRGLFYYLVFILKFGLLVCIACIIVSRKFWINKMHLLLWPILSVMAYSIYVGGDAWDNWGGANRYISVAMPLLFIFLSGSMYFLTKILEKYIRGKPIIWRSKARKLLWVILLIIVCSWYSEAYAWALWGQTTRYIPVAMFLLCVLILGCIFLNTRQLGHLLKNKIVVFYMLLILMLTIRINSFNGIDSLKDLILCGENYYAIDSVRMVSIANNIKETTNKEAKIAVVWAGSIPYFSERYSVDLLGKNDKKIAREKMHILQDVPVYKKFYPGHLKWDYQYSVGKQRPDVIAQLWKNQAEAKSIMGMNYILKIMDGEKLYYLKNSKNVLWDKII
ncbi:MAG: hypothetical protein A2452_03355 [Candidatus Firestonebacteria bacterium RIFOXYC2_FULL_39_67]|nr:MAG: hypothetical protein A2536_02770 [Candidatus Firestonebacteria bacterium RIFOXYD2_FULL_39_29]OGF55305.1 MAG: hypothetical protein A2452_03355 [Candidatus Firestonebacteria bacterium RIFOXYC2_FULL_39_67]